MNAFILCFFNGLGDGHRFILNKGAPEITPTTHTDD
jgi:hypothetical protein